MNNVRCVWVLPFVIASICLAGASSAFAQGTGTLTGTVVDAQGSAVPGATSPRLTPQPPPFGRWSQMKMDCSGLRH